MAITPTTLSLELVSSAVPYTSIGTAAVRVVVPTTVGYDDSFDAGYADADARSVGYTRGRLAGQNEGFDDGAEDGAADQRPRSLGAGIELGKVAGYSDAFSDGYRDAVARSVGYTAGRLAGQSDAAADVEDAAASAHLQGLAEGLSLSSGPVGVAPPVVTPVSPTPDVAAGDAGGWPGDSNAAAQVPILITVSNADAIVVSVIRGERVEELAYLDGWRGTYVLGSSGTATLSILPVGGWDSDTVVTVEAFRDAGASPVRAGFTYLFPTTTAPEPEAEAPTDGTIDHVAEAFDQLPWLLGEVEEP
jgi:hypothetical protein